MIILISYILGMEIPNVVFRYKIMLIMLNRVVECLFIFW